MTDHSTQNRWLNAQARLMIPSNMKEVRDTFISNNVENSNSITSSCHNTLLPTNSPVFQYPSSITAEIRAERLGTNLRTPRTNLLPQALEVLKRSVKIYGRGNVLFASDPPIQDDSVDSSSIKTTSATNCSLEPTSKAPTSIQTISSTPATTAPPPTPAPPPTRTLLAVTAASTSVPFVSTKKKSSTKIGVTGSTIPIQTQLSRRKALKYLKKYLSSNRLDGHCTVKFCENLPSAGIFVNRPRATLARINCDDAYFGGDEDCKHSLLVSDKLLSPTNNTVSATRIVSFAVHEIGTHLVRRSNEEIQPWLHKHKKYNMIQDERVIKATEEGLAMVHEAMHLPSLLLARPALYYFASARAIKLSFAELYAELEEWVSDPLQRFDVRPFYFFSPTPSLFEFVINTPPPLIIHLYSLNHLLVLFKYIKTDLFFSQKRNRRHKHTRW